ncbi:Na+/H+ antiporter [Cohnella sp. 56]|uniref:Na+/H+ antiporter n=1 Tax=Cohnella sp. 56 TaxID=3113722 RepID=UPI0030EA6A51
MEVFEIILFLLAIIALSNVLNRLLPVVPLPLVQIALGMAVAGLPLGHHLTLNPELFFVLFIAPLLFNDGQRTPRDELWELRGPILLMALGLVFATTVGVGYIIHAMIPSIPLPAAFGLAAILSPTDAVAVTSMAGRAALPKRIMRLLEGEALMNDASGLVAFKFAIAAAVTGSFSLVHATGSFILISIGGLLCGALVAALLIRLRLLLRRWGMEDVTVHMLILILTPFVIFLVAEELGLSGILAVVAGGVVHAIEKDRMESRMVKLQIVSASTWSVILYVLNGLVFLLLGLQVPEVVNVIFFENPINNGIVIGYIAVIFLSLIALRFLWVYLFWENRFSRNNGRSMKEGLGASALTSLSGVRGAVTLAGAFSIPLVLNNGDPFPQRDLILFLAAGVILISLIVASVALPILTRNQAQMPSDEEEKLNAARIATIKAALRFISESITEDNRNASHAVIAQYEARMRRLSLHEEEETGGIELALEETRARLVGLAAERKEIASLFAAGEIPDYVANRFNDSFSALEEALSRRSKMRALLLTRGLRQLSALIFKPREQEPRLDKSIIRKTKLKTSQAAIAAIRAQIVKENRKASLNVIAQYREFIRAISRKDADPEDDLLQRKQRQEIQLRAYQIERDEIQALYERGEIRRDMANTLRKTISYAEATILETELA